MSELERLREEAEAEMRRKAPRYALDSPTLHDPLARRLRRLEPRPSASRPISLTADAPAAAVVTHAMRSRNQRRETVVS